jgi:hypothetical protein
MPMPEIDLDSLREVPWAPRRTVTPPASFSENPSGEGS